MDKYTHLKKLNHGRRLGVYICALMFVDHETIAVEENFPATKVFFVNYKKMSTPRTVPKYLLGIS